MKSRKKIIVFLIVLVLLICSGCSRGKQDNFVFTKKPVTEEITTTTIKEETSVCEKETVNDRPKTTQEEVDSVSLPETIVPENSVLEDIETTVTSESVSEIPENNENEPSNYIKIKDLPDDILDLVKSWQAVYPYMSIGVGIYSLDGTQGYEYNADCFINSACTIKAAYALYVLEEAENRDIDIWNTYIVYQKKHSDNGSGEINLNGEYGMEYSIGYLLYIMLYSSDNVAYNMLLDEFPLNEFYVQNCLIGGESDYQKWGKATVNQRKNEWVAIWSYINSGRRYSQVLRDDLSYTLYAYFLEGMYGWHSYLQKSGWTEDTLDYPATGEAAIIDESYLLIVLTEDYTSSSGHIEVLQSIGGAVESFWYQNNGYIF